MPRKKFTPESNRYNNPFPTRLRELIQETKTTQQSLADVLGLKNRQSIGYYLDGTSYPDLDSVATIAKHFHVSADWLLGLSDTRNPDATMQAICKRTGLEESIVNRLVDTRQEEGHRREANCVNFFLSSPNVRQMLHTLYIFKELNQQDEARRQANLSGYTNPLEALAADMADGTTYQQDARKYAMIGMATEAITSLLPSTSVNEMMTEQEGRTHAEEK